MRCTNWSSHRLRSLMGSLALYSSLVSSVLKKLLTLGWPAIDVKQLAVASYTAPPPDADLRLGIECTRRQLDHRRKHVRFRIRIHAGPWRFAADMRLGEIPFATGIEQVLDSVKVEKERVATAASEQSVGAGFDDIRLGAEGN